MEEGGKETTRRLVGAIVAAVFAAPAALGSLVSYFNNSIMLAVISGVLSFVGVLSAVYFGIKVGSDN